MLNPTVIQSVHHTLSTDHGFTDAELDRARLVLRVLLEALRAQEDAARDLRAARLAHAAADVA